MFHLGKIICIAQTAFILLLLQVNVYKRVIAQLRPGLPSQSKKVETNNALPM